MFLPHPKFHSRRPTVPHPAPSYPISPHRHRRYCLRSHSISRTLSPVCPPLLNHHHPPPPHLPAPPLHPHALQKYVKPRTREERRNLSNKETLEKDRLKKRNEGYNRYVDLGKVTEPTKLAVGYLAEHERFDTDYAFEEKGLRDARLARQEQIYVNKRQQNAEREEGRWNQIDTAKREEEEMHDRWREDGSKVSGARGGGGE